MMNSKKVFTSTVVFLLAGLVFLFTASPVLAQNGGGIIGKMRGVLRSMEDGGDAGGGEAGGGKGDGGNLKKDKDKPKKVLASSTDQDGNTTTVSDGGDGVQIIDVTDKDGKPISTTRKKKDDSGDEWIDVTDHTTGKVTKTLVGKDGQTIFSDTYDSVMRDDDGNITGWTKNDDRGRETESLWQDDNGNTYYVDRDPDTGNIAMVTMDKDSNIVSTSKTDYYPEGGYKSTDTDYATGEVKNTLYDDDGNEIYSETKDSEGRDLGYSEEGPGGAMVDVVIDPETGERTADYQDKDGKPISGEYQVPTESGGQMTKTTDHATGIVSAVETDADGKIIGEGKAEPIPGGGQKIKVEDYVTGEVINMEIDDQGKTISKEVKDKEGRTVKTFNKNPDGSTFEMKINYETGLSTITKTSKDGKVEKFTGKVESMRTF